MKAIRLICSDKTVVYYLTNNGSLGCAFASKDFSNNFVISTEGHDYSFENDINGLIDRLDGKDQIEAIEIIH